jgi:tRNA U55 pseudouridine synthase TruB
LCGNLEKKDDKMINSGTFCGRNEMAQENSQGSKEKVGLGKKIEDAAAVHDAQEFLRGRKQVKVIKKSAIKEIVDSLIAEYGGLEHSELLAKMAEYELRLADAPRLAELEELLEKSREESAKREDELNRKLKALQEIIAGDQLRKRLEELECEVIALQSRVEELMRGLEYAAAVEELDYSEAICAAEEQMGRLNELESRAASVTETDPENRSAAVLAEILPEIRRRNEIFKNAFEQNSVGYAELVEKMHDNEGSIDVIVDLVRMSVKSKWYRWEMKVFDRILDYAQIVVGE